MTSLSAMDVFMTTTATERLCDRYCDSSDCGRSNYHDKQCHCEGCGLKGNSMTGNGLDDYQTHRHHDHQREEEKQKHKHHHVLPPVHVSPEGIISPQQPVGSRSDCKAFCKEATCYLGMFHAESKTCRCYGGCAKAIYGPDPLGIKDPIDITPSPMS